MKPLLLLAYWLATRKRIVFRHEAAAFGHSLVGGEGELHRHLNGTVLFAVGCARSGPVRKELPPTMGQLPAARSQEGDLQPRGGGPHHSTAQGDGQQVSLLGRTVLCHCTLVRSVPCHRTRRWALGKLGCTVNCHLIQCTVYSVLSHYTGVHSVIGQLPVRRPRTGTFRFTVNTDFFTVAALSTVLVAVLAWSAVQFTAQVGTVHTSTALKSAGNPAHLPNGFLLMSMFMRYC